MSPNYHKLPRLFTAETIRKESPVPLTEEQAHYLKNVMRRAENDEIRLFNGHDGEWVARLAFEKKSAFAVPEERLRLQPDIQNAIHLFFAPIKKARMEWMVEKAVELGVTDFHPVLTHNTEVRDINETRLQAQMQEAAEQCERLTIPVLHSLQNMDKALQSWPVTQPLYACVERIDAPPPAATMQEYGLLVGPEGGFSLEERRLLLDHPKVKAISLGPLVLRSETAMMKAVVLLTP